MTREQADELLQMALVGPVPDLERDRLFTLWLLTVRPANCRGGHSGQKRGVERQRGSFPQRRADDRLDGGDAGLCQLDAEGSNRRELPGRQRTA